MLLSSSAEEGDGGDIEDDQEVLSMALPPLVAQEEEEGDHHHDDEYEQQENHHGGGSTAARPHFTDVPSPQAVVHQPSPTKSSLGSPSAHNQQAAIGTIFQNTTTAIAATPKQSTSMPLPISDTTPLPFHNSKLETEDSLPIDTHHHHQAGPPPTLEPHHQSAFSSTIMPTPVVVGNNEYNELTVSSCGGGSGGGGVSGGESLSSSSVEKGSMSRNSSLPPKPSSSHHHRPRGRSSSTSSQNRSITRGIFDNQTQRRVPGVIWRGKPSPSSSNKVDTPESGRLKYFPGSKDIEYSPNPDQRQSLRALNKKKGLPRSKSSDSHMSDGCSLDQKSFTKQQRPSDTTQMMMRRSHSAAAERGRLFEAGNGGSVRRRLSLGEREEEFKREREREREYNNKDSRLSAFRPYAGPAAGGGGGGTGAVGDISHHHHHGYGGGSGGGGGVLPVGGHHHHHHHDSTLPPAAGWDLKAQLRTKDSQIHFLKDQVHDIRNDYEKKMMSMEHDLQEKEFTIQQMQEVWTDQQHQKRKDGESFSAESEQKDRQIHELRDLLEEAQSRQQQLESALDEHEEDAAGEVAKLRSDVQQLHEELHLKLQTIEILDEKLRRKEEDLCNLGSSNETVLNELNTTIKAHLTRIQNLTKDVEEKDTIISDLRLSLLQADSQLAEGAASSQETMQRQTEEMKQMRDTIQRYEGTIVLQTQNHRKLMQQVSDLESQLSQARQQAELSKPPPCLQDLTEREMQSLSNLTLTEREFVLTTRGSLLQYVHSLYTPLSKCCDAINDITTMKTDTEPYKDTILGGRDFYTTTEDGTLRGIKLAELLPAMWKQNQELTEVNEALEDARGTLHWIVSNLFTEDEKQGVGASTAEFPAPSTPTAQAEEVH
eukprot:TRINITY_DN51640_c0_g1_i2.p1 TRINITY_DN51640_c0_g1~~TRINITY_DN51640_c0_g1_i2.p1  ORF type:complete len:954 (+),score=169.75 TRINITY_DN51640_c0_g1_i2:227-2863(+)